jgi:hypothetical protein
MLHKREGHTRDRVKARSHACAPTNPGRLGSILDTSTCTGSFWNEGYFMTWCETPSTCTCAVCAFSGDAVLQGKPERGNPVLLVCDLA